MSTPIKPRRRKSFPRTLFECMEPVTKPVFRKHGITEMKLIRDWAQIVGPALSACSAPHQVKYPAGKQDEATLVIHVTGSMATLLQHMEPLLIDKLATYFGYRAIGRIQLKHLSPPQAKTAPRLPPAPEMADRLAELARSLQSDEA